MVYGTACRASHGIWNGLADITWCRVWSGEAKLGMWPGSAWHGIWHGLVSVTQTSHGTSDENRLCQRGSGEKRQFSCNVSDWCHTNVTPITAQFRVDHVIGQGKNHLATIMENFQFLWGHFLCNYLGSNIHFYINCMLILKFECSNSQKLPEMHFCSKIVDLSYERGR